MVSAVTDFEAPNRRTVAIVASAIGGLFVVLVAGSVVLQSFGTINAQNEIAAAGQTISVRVDNGLDIRVDLTVTALEPRANDAQPAADFYLVRYEVSGIDEFVPDMSDGMWRLVDANGTVFAAAHHDMPGCERFAGVDGQGCAVVRVPTGTEVVMVRYYGVKTFWYEGKPTPSEVWAGWRV